MMLTFIITGMPADTFFSLVGVKLGDGPLLGILVHSLVGLTGGGGHLTLFVMNVNALRIDTSGKD
jgi:hypothetical protein